jgi:hypothetical protein
MKKTKRDFEEAATKKNMREKMSLPFFYQQYGKDQA